MLTYGNIISSKFIKKKIIYKYGNIINVLKNRKIYKIKIINQKIEIKKNKCK